MITVTIEQAQQIRLLSDGELYRDAVDLVAKHAHSKISSSQLSGLWNAVGAGEKKEISDFITNRLNRNTISEDLKAFYGDIEKYLKGLPKQVEETQLVEKPEEMGRAQRRQMRVEVERYAYLLAKEFIQHLVAECNYQRSLSNA